MTTPSCDARGTRFSIVVPTIGRPSLRTLLDALAAGSGPRPSEIVLVDDRKLRQEPLDSLVPASLSGAVRVVLGRARGPAAARNDGWRCAHGEWIAFLDDDVVPGPEWLEDLAADLDAADASGDSGSAGRIIVPLPDGRRPTDWERNTAGLQHARWATADLAYRRSALIDVAGFDERFPRAYREDADIALRLRAAGHSLAIGDRQIAHPVRPTDWRVSLRLQRGNADDALMRMLHGPQWRRAAEAFPGRRGRHFAVTAAATVALAASVAGRRKLATRAFIVWTAGVLEFACARTALGPRSAGEIATMAATSPLIPPLAVGHWLAGRWRWRNARPWPDRPIAVLFDRDGTLVHDVPYNGDPDRVTPMPGAKAALAELRTRGVRVAVVSNQSGVGRGRISLDDVAAVNARIEKLLGPIGFFATCPHAEEDGCDCRKPAPGLIRQAAAALAVSPRHCVVIGDIGSDIEAAERAGAVGILAPTPRTRAAETAASRYVAGDLSDAVRMAIGLPASRRRNERRDLRMARS